MQGEIDMVSLGTITLILLTFVGVKCPPLLYPYTYICVHVYIYCI